MTMTRSYLDRNPEDGPGIKAWRQTGQMVPIAQNGEFVALVNRNVLAKTAPPVPLPVADYGVGLELLGFRFAIGTDRDGTDALFYQPPDNPDAWDEHGNRIRAAFGRGRSQEAIAFPQTREREA